MVHTPLSFNKYAFAERNPVLPNSRGDHQATDQSKLHDNRTNSDSNEIQPTSLIHYQPITPAVLYYTGNSNSAGSDGLPTSTTTMVNVTQSSSGIVQPVSLAHYQPITPAAFSDVSTNSIDNSNAVHHESSSGSEDNNHNDKTYDSGTGDHHSSNGKNHSEVNHSYKFHHKSSSSQYNNDVHGDGVDNYHNGDQYNSHHHGNHEGDSIIISSGDDYEGYEDTGHGHDYTGDYGNDNEDDGDISIASNSGAFASAGSGGAFASAG